MTTTRLGLALCGALALSACGNAKEEAPLIEATTTLFGDFFGGGGGGDSAEASGKAAPSRGNLTRAAIEAYPTEVMIASVPSRKPAALVAKTGTNGTESTWFAEDNISVSYDQGVLIATRGFGPDLMGADVSQVKAALRSGGGTAERIHDYLDGGDHILRRSYDCRIQAVGTETLTIYEEQHATTKYEEACQSGSVSFTNSYWVDGQGVIWRSRQLVSPPLGYLDTLKL